jgi:hypothetical protein
MSLFENFLIPLLMVLLLTRGRARRVLIVFIVSSLIQLVLIPPDLSVPNWALIEWAWITLLIRYLRHLPKQILSPIVFTIILWLALGQPSVA